MLGPPPETTGRHWGTTEPAGIGMSAVVTGAGRGIGRSVARSLTRDGWFVVGLTRSRPADGADEGGVARMLHGDASDPGLVETAAALAADAAPLRGWVNNVAPVTTTDPTDDPDSVLDQLRRTVEPAVVGTHVALRHLVRGGTSTIVNIGSVHGRVSVPGYAAYEMGKAALDALTRSVAVAHAPDGIRALTVAPGGVVTPGLRAHVEDDQASLDRLADLSPSRRLADPDEVGELVAFLLSGRCAYLTGQSLLVDGGWLVSAGLHGDAR